ncbi:hypothetical protein GGI25_000771 [Coemansia spiralis]|uniref:Uncharacterized protein n=2 Tax=Coemansia TaxID=4863 RepID=A0A9W8GBW9_9FUNG|nr:hypothetical protein EDC05_005861 [Coemansia umbellata]KAJ2621939.1 hypothetical protein GGI26_003643 [Coemansia sp. RSA 1358]KAJ2680479.1 hypothetical protein GGI25_000771 [Coemansia spiralis]
MAQAAILFIGCLFAAGVAVLLCCRARNTRLQDSDSLSFIHNASQRHHAVQQPQRAQVARNIGLGVRGIVTASRNPRRYHSIAILTESTPLLMETGDEFFAPPSKRTSRRLSRFGPQKGTPGIQDRAPSNAGRLVPNGGRFATTNAIFADKSGASRLQLVGGGRRVFTLPSLVGSSASASLNTVLKDSGDNYPDSSSESTAFSGNG